MGNNLKLALCRYRSMRVMQQAVRKMVKTAQKFAKRTAAAIKMQVCPDHASAYSVHSMSSWSDGSNARRTIGAQMHSCCITGQKGCRRQLVVYECLLEPSGSAGTGKGVPGALRVPQARGGAPGCRRRCAGSDRPLGAHCCRPPVLPATEVCPMMFAWHQFHQGRWRTRKDPLRGFAMQHSEFNVCPLYALESFQHGTSLRLFCDAERIAWAQY